MASDFGRQVNGGIETRDVAEALRQRAVRTAKAEAWRYHVAMAAIGFAGGMAVIVPALLWLRLGQPVEVAQQAAPAAPVELRTAAAEPSGARQSLIDAAHRPEREAPAESVEATASAPVPQAVPQAEAQGDSQQARAGAVAEALTAARGLIRAGDLLAARAILTHPQLADAGEAAFMLAETFDPNVLAALGTHGMLADALLARRHYEAALAKGIAAASVRIEALK